MKNPNRNKNFGSKEIQLFVSDPSQPDSSENPIELNLKVKFQFSIGNNSFDHAFGTQYYPDYIEEVFNIEMFFLNAITHKSVDYKVGDKFPLNEFVNHIGDDSIIHDAKDADDFLAILEKLLVDSIEKDEPDYPDRN